MSAELADTRLTLRGDKSLPRELVVSLIERRLYAQVFAPRSRPFYRSIAFSYHPLTECRLDEKDNGACYTLWVGDSAFDVTPQEAAEIHALLAPLGLRSAFKVAP